MSKHPRTFGRALAVLGVSTALALVSFATAQDYTGTYSNGGDLTLVLDQNTGGQVFGHLVMMAGNYRVQGTIQSDGTAQGSFASEGNSFYQFVIGLDADGSSMTLVALAVTVTGQPIGTPSQRVQLTRVSRFGRAPASPLPTAPNQVPGRPDAVVLPPAGSFVPGVRVVYYIGAASTMESRGQAVEDPTCEQTKGPDCYYQPETNKWYRVKNVVPLGTLGIMQLDLLHLDANFCVARTTNYGLDPITGLVTYLGSNGFLGRLGACGEYWIPPDRLVQAARQSPGSVEVFLGPYDLGGRTFEAVRLGATSVSGSHQTYQASSGILIVGSDRTTGTALTIGPDLFLRTSVISTHLAYTQFLSMREIGGYTGEPLPQHVQAANRLTYSCSTVTSMPGMPDVQAPCLQQALIGERTSHWALVRTVHQDPNSATGRTFPQEGLTVITAGSPGGIFASPSVLAGLQAGQSVDFDPHTGVTTFVSYRDESVVTVVEQGQLHRQELTYDLASGWLVGSVLVRHLSPLTVTVSSRLEAIE